MAQYKVIQDIEAEDKLLGPLTLKGFIYAIIAIFCAFINFRLITSGIGPLKWLFVLMFLLPMVLFGVLASPLGRHQPTEVWLLAHLRFLIKPKRRIWSQSGIQQLVKITAPKKVDAPRTKGLSETEVMSRLQTLASTLDSRGWAVKNMYSEPGVFEDIRSDRLAEPTMSSSTSIGADIHPSDDILDEDNNPTAQYFNGLMRQADASRKVGVANKLSAARETAFKAERDTKPRVEPGHKKLMVPNENIDKKVEANSVTPQPNLDAPQSDYRLLRSSSDHTQDALSTVERASFGAGQADKNDKMTDADRADKLELAQSGNDFSVATLSKLANRGGQFKQLGPNEGVLELH